MFRSIISGNMDPSVQVGVAACGHYIFVAGLRRAEFVLTEQVSREKVFAAIRSPTGKFIESQSWRNLA